jgi:hypothetical protein
MIYTELLDMIVFYKENPQRMIMRSKDRYEYKPHADPISAV